jgi:hypothetical protein
MIETLTIITITVVLLLLFRPGTPPPLDNPLTIERPGKYHMTLAPRLNLAQPFLEAVAEEPGVAAPADHYSATRYYEVRDRQVRAHGNERYLLAATRRNGLLYFQAVSPPANGDALAAIKEFAAGVLSRAPESGTYHAELDAAIDAAIDAAAGVRQIAVKPLA